MSLTYKHTSCAQMYLFHSVMPNLSCFETLVHSYSGYIHVPNNIACGTLNTSAALRTKPV